MRSMRHIVLLSVSALLAVGVCAAQAPDAHLIDVLSQLDAASQRFQHARAEFVWEYYEAAARDTTRQNGSIYFDRARGGAVQMGAVVLDAKGAKDKVLEYKGGQLRLFDLGIDQIRTLSAGANQAQYESFLTLGFGGSGHDLARSWTIRDLGSETITDDGQPVKTEKLDLVSKEESVRNMFTHITIWVDLQRAVTLKQFFETPSHDHRTALYSHIKVNAPLDTATFTIKPGKKTTYIR